MAHAQKGDPLKKVKDSLSFKNRTIEKFNQGKESLRETIKDIARASKESSYDYITMAGFRKALKKKKDKKNNLPSG